MQYSRMLKIPKVKSFLMLHRFYDSRAELKVSVLNLLKAIEVQPQAGGT